MEITDYTKAAGMFLKADDVKKNPTAIFAVTSEGVLSKSEKFGNMRLHVDGEFGGESKTFDISKTNARAIADKLGSDTKKWIGHQFVLETYKTKTSDGKLVDAINVKEIK
jgi:hypothetical protein